MNVIGLDLGTTTVSGVTLNSNTGEQLDAITVTGDAYIGTTESWRQEQDPQKIYNICERIVQYLVERVPGVECIGMTGQMHGIVYLNEFGELLGPLCTWEDGRGNLSCRNGITYAGQLSHITGWEMATGYGLTTHYFNLLNHIVPVKARYISTIVDYVAMRLCGLKCPVIHPSNAAGLGLFDVDSYQFDTAALEAAGIYASLLPEVVTEERLIGHTKGGISVAIPIGDNQAGVLGALQSQNDAVLSIGTSSQISALCDTVCAQSELAYRPFIDKQYIMLGSGLCGGSAFRLLNDLFREVAGFSQNVSSEEIFARMEQQAWKEYKNGDSLHIETLFRGTRKRPEIRGTISNISMTNFTAGNLALGFFRGVCQEMFQYYEMMPDRVKSKGALIACGNATRKNSLLLRVIRDIFHKEVIASPYAEEAACGAAKLAARVAGGNVCKADRE